MLGIAQNAQRAGWGARGFAGATLDASSTFYKTIYQPAQTPQIHNYGQNINNVDRFTSGGQGTYDLTGLTSQTGYNYRKFVFATTFYVEWPSGLSAGTYLGCPFGLELNNGTGSLYSNLNFDLDYTGAFRIGGAYDQYYTVTLPGAYTNWTNRWLTLIYVGSNTSASYTSWSPGSNVNGSSNYDRMAIYDTEYNTLLAKTDYVNNANRMDLSTLPTTCPTVWDNGAPFVNWFAFGSGNPTDGFQTFRMASTWISLGTMFDPLQSTDRSWLSSYPNDTIEGVQSWYNLTFENFNSSSGNFVGSRSHRYSQTNNYLCNWTNSPSEYATLSTTIIPKDKS